jgi:hypothetical protein
MGKCSDVDRKLFPQLPNHAAPEAIATALRTLSWLDFNQRLPDGSGKRLRGSSANSLQTSSQGFATLSNEE